ncbi:leucyl aminopeptidase family protein [Xanthocytophaga flava]|uniref:leucyl aminopeptidase family protein n=1 Tax=Xanthocytophaga flava TaxID=3048013 RepID=UPI0028D0BCA2|nr:leucyl aminopeptidase [Xanthocytophaga flavus]MDJ1470592.1 leucyl aminopeptidase [Xanthocytophaga flavus]
MNIQLYSQIQPQIQALIIPVWQDTNLQSSLTQIAEKFQLSDYDLQNDFKADSKEVLFFYVPTPSEKLKKVYLLGLGKPAGSIEVLKAFRYLFFSYKTKLPAALGIDLTLQASANSINYLENIINGALLGGYDLNLYKTNKSDSYNFFQANPSLDLYVSQESMTDAEKAVSKGKAIAETQIRIMNLGNAPGNYKTPQTLATWALESGREWGYDVTILDKSQLIDIGAEALLAVNKGSANPPVMIVLEYKPDSAAASQKIGLVGKGVTFDTGGISLKDSANMHLMKSDMGGAAAVLGTIELAARLQLPVHLIGVIPSTENSVDGESTKPGDVIGSYAGKTIEVIDTDAEGRLILADALAYVVKNYQPDVLIDLATLTGSVIGTLGYVAAGLFTTNDTLSSELIKVSEQTGEKLWRLPMWDDYRDDLKSDVADVKNYHGKPFAGAIMGAKFLEVFTNSHSTWAHLDIAGTAFTESEYGTQKNATAYGIRLLTAYIEQKI